MASRMFHSLSGRVLHDLAQSVFTTLKPGGYFALLLAAQTRRTCQRALAIWITHSWVISLHLRQGLSPSDGLAARWLEHISQNKSAVPGERGDCSRPDLLILRKPLHARETSFASFLSMQTSLDSIRCEFACPQINSSPTNVNQAE